MSADLHQDLPIIPKRVRALPGDAAPPSPPAPDTAARFVVRVPDVTSLVEAAARPAFWRRWPSTRDRAGAWFQFRWLAMPAQLGQRVAHLCSPQLWLQPKVILSLVCLAVAILVAAIVTSGGRQADDPPHFVPEWRAPTVEMPPQQPEHPVAGPHLSLPTPAAALDLDESQATAPAPPHAAHNEAALSADQPTGAATANQPAKIGSTDPRPVQHVAERPEPPRDPTRGQPPVAQLEGNIDSPPADYRP